MLYHQIYFAHRSVLLSFFAKFGNNTTLIKGGLPFSYTLKIKIGKFTESSLFSFVRTHHTRYNFILTVRLVI